MLPEIEIKTILAGMVFDLAMASMEYNGEGPEVWNEIMKATPEEMINYLIEFYEG